MPIELTGAVALLEVADVERSVAFYRDALGFALVQEARNGSYVGWAWVRNGDAEIMFNAMFEPDDPPSTPDPTRVLAHRDTTIFLGCRDLDGAAAHIRATGVAASGPTVTHYGMRQLSLSDPDGYGLCLQWAAA